MSIEELGFRWYYFWDTFKKWLFRGGVFCKDQLYWDLWVNEERVEWHIGSFGQFVKWIVTHEPFNNL